MTCCRDISLSLSRTILMTVLGGLRYVPSASCQSRLVYVIAQSGTSSIEHQVLMLGHPSGCYVALQNRTYRLHIPSHVGRKGVILMLPIAATSSAITFTSGTH